jgi:putative YjhG/YagF family dehydratase
MLMALASSGALPSVLVPGGVTLLAKAFKDHPAEDAGKVQTIGARFAQGEITQAYAAEVGCRACATPGGGCQFLGTAATSQVVAEALGLALPHSALAPSGQPVWLDAAARSARALLRLSQLGVATNTILTDAAVRNAMVLHAAFGGSTNLLLHLPAIAHAAGLRRPSVGDWTAINRGVPRLVDALPNGPLGFATVQVFLAGGVPEAMLHLRRAGLLDTSVRTITGETLGENLDWWEFSERRKAMKDRLRVVDGVDAEDVIFSPDQARARGIARTLCFPTGNLAPEGSVIKSTAIDPSLLDESGAYRHTGPARVFVTEASAIDAIKRGSVGHGDVLVIICGGPMGAGMQETYQVTSALKSLPFCKHVAVLTDARFSGVSTGACVGHISPEALAGGPIGRVREGDLIEIQVNGESLEASIHLIGEDGQDGVTRFSPEEGARRLAARPPRDDLAPLPALPSHTRLWAALVQASGGVWGGCVYDTDAIVDQLSHGSRRHSGTDENRPSHVGPSQYEEESI